MIACYLYVTKDSGRRLNVASLKNNPKNEIANELILKREIYAKV